MPSTAFYCVMRKEAREVVFKILYSELYSDYNEDLFIELCNEFRLNAADSDFAKRLLTCVHENKAQIDGVISSLAENYKLERVYYTDRCALSIGIAEMTYFDDIPNVVAIDEAINLCRIYSTKESTSFVNGIFAKYKTILENK